MASISVVRAVPTAMQRIPRDVATQGVTATVKDRAVGAIASHGQVVVNLQITALEKDSKENKEKSRRLV